MKYAELKAICDDPERDVVMNGIDDVTDEQLREAMNDAPKSDVQTPFDEYILSEISARLEREFRKLGIHGEELRAIIYAECGETTTECLLIDRFLEGENLAELAAELRPRE